MPLPNPLGTTDLAVVSPLSPGGQPLYRNYEVLEREVAARLSRRHAALFAEPQVGETLDQIDWYGPPGRFKKLADLPEEEQETVRNVLADLFKDLFGLSEQLAESASEDDRFLSRLIDLSLRVPSEDSILAGPKGPILLNWGTLPRGEPTSYNVLRVLHDQQVENRKEAESAIAETKIEPGGPREPLGFEAPKTPSATPPEYPELGAKPTPKQGPDVSPVHITLMRTGLPKAVVVASGLVSLLLVVSIGGLLLNACGIALPSLSGAGYPLLTFCNKPSRNTEMLLTVIDSYEREIAVRSATCGADVTEEIEPTQTPQDQVDSDEEPTHPGLQGVTRLSSLEPAIGKMCSITVCRSGQVGKISDEGCATPAELIEQIRPQVPENHCRYFLDLRESNAAPGTRFAAEVQFLINDELYKTWPAEGITYPNDLMAALRRNGQPRLYWVTDFEWPPTDFQPNQEEK